MELIDSTKRRLHGGSGLTLRQREAIVILERDEVLAYRSDEVVQRFAADHAVTRADAEEIFLETKRWLWLCASPMASAEDGVGEGVPLLSEARAIDLMWHTLLLFSKDYAKFCQIHFGFFVHHQPRTQPRTQVEKEAWERQVRENPTEALRERREMLRRATRKCANVSAPQR